MKTNADQGLADARFELMKQEIDTLTTTIRNIDGVCQSLKNWTITLWSGGMAVCFAATSNVGEKYIFFVAIIPILFWYSDVYWSTLQRKFIYRYEKIGKYINGNNFKENFGGEVLTKFRLMDIQSRDDRDQEEFKSFTCFWQVAKFRTITPFYFFLSFLSIIAWVFLVL